ncbi:MAG: acetyl-CoA carboxylase carboxyl transferase subunit alpha [Gammaproteobacteria bacterium]|nr:acetyl-CoA carboxylase carboxyl transferase subunit alpha [Gammaproteobacteria bacterium]
MNLNYLDFEQPISELKAKIEELRAVNIDNGINISEEITKLEKRCEELTQSIFSDLKSFQIVQLARHPLRPYTLDYIERIFTDFEELQGDRHFSKGNSIVGGIAKLDKIPVVIMGQQKGRKTQEKIARNFGVCRPEDYRKALRLMKLAEKFALPVLTFIDTTGAYPGMDAEEHNQSEAIARNLFTLARLKTPVICTIIGEGGSGGALAIGVADRVLMLQYSIYSVISPEGCASILWKNTKKAIEAAEMLGLTADRLLKANLIDQIIQEPLGGAHRDVDFTAKQLKLAIKDQLNTLCKLNPDELLKKRYDRLMAYGISN